MIQLFCLSFATSCLQLLHLRDLCQFKLLVVFFPFILKFVLVVVDKLGNFGLLLSYPLLFLELLHHLYADSRIFESLAISGVDQSNMY